MRQDTRNRMEETEGRKDISGDQNQAETVVEMRHSGD